MSACPFTFEPFDLGVYLVNWVPAAIVKGIQLVLCCASPLFEQCTFTAVVVLKLAVTVVQAAQLDVDLLGLDLGIGVAPVLSRVQLVDFVPYVLDWAVTEPVQPFEFALLLVAQVFERLEFWIDGRPGCPEVLPFGIQFSLIDLDGPLQKV